MNVKRSAIVLGISISHDSKPAPQKRTMFVLAKRKSPIAINMIILREFVLKSGHIQYVIKMVEDPKRDSEAAAVDRIFFRGASVLIVALVNRSNAVLL